MDNGYIIDTPIYNSKTYLYDVTVVINEEVKQVSCHRILNSTPLLYSQDPGYFYISTDSKYIFFTDTVVISEFLKNIEFSINNPTKTNNNILDINNDPIQKYTSIGLSTISDTMCINLALEDNDKDRLDQIKNAGKYNSYDCMVKNISTPSVEAKKDTIYERLTDLFTPTNTQTPTQVTEVNIVDIHTYNKFYVYGLSTLNILLIIIIVLILLMITSDNTDKNNHNFMNRYR